MPDPGPARPDVSSATDRAYQPALDFLYPRVTTIKFGLDNTRALLETVGNPQLHFPAIHVGGTNGKGSVCAMLAAALAAAGLRVGMYTSPHLASFRERIQVDGVPISRDAVAAWTHALRPAIESRGATFFEATTAMAFADFAARQVDLAVVEVGLGGRLDSTNVLTPLVSGVTHIAMDHMKYLGDDLSSIAREKAGIAKPGVPFVIGEPDPALAQVLAAEAARRMGDGASELIHVIPPERRWHGPVGIPGGHQRRNAAVAAAMLERLPSHLRPSAAAVGAGIGGASLAGRLQRVGRWLFDVAHNPDGMRSLTEALTELRPTRPLHAIVSILGDKDWAAMLVELDRVVDKGILTIAPSADTRRWSTSWLTDWLESPARPPAHATWSLVEDFDAAIRLAESGAGTILVTGSFHTVGDAMARLGLIEADGG